MTVEELRVHLYSSIPYLFECAPAPKGNIRIRTPFLYPDGDVIDVFVVEGEGYFVITDFGEALGWLRLQSSQGALSHRQMSLVEHICLTLEVKLAQGQLYRYATREEISTAVLAVVQAILRVADLSYTS